MRFIRIAIILLIAGGAIQMLARHLWRDRIDALSEALHAPRAARAAAPQVSGLPAPVARFLAASVSPDRQVRAVVLDTAGEFLMAPGPRGWKPFRAHQRFNAVAPGFVWDATISMAPFVPVNVRDAYVGGRGEMVARVAGLYAPVNESGSKELAEGQLVRYLAEMMWFPSALEPGHGVTWTPIDDHRAMAHLEDSSLKVSLQFTFNDQADIVEVFAPARMRAVKNGYEATPWAVRCHDHEDRMGFRIPIVCEAEWRTKDGPLPYWRGRVTNIRYEN